MTTERQRTRARAHGPEVRLQHALRLLAGALLVAAFAACAGGSDRDDAAAAGPARTPPASTVEASDAAGAASPDVQPAADDGQAEDDGRASAAGALAQPSADPRAATAASAESPAARSTPGQDAARRVRTVTVATGRLAATKNASVTIEAARQSQVAAGTSGRVARVHARPGEVVAEGAVVVSLDDDQLQAQLENAELAVQSAEVSLTQAQRQSSETIAQLQAQLQSAQTNLNLAEERYREGSALLEAGGISRVDLRSLEASRDQAQSGWVQARDGLARARRASQEDLRLLELQVEQARNRVAQARNSLAEAQISAPFAGEVADVFVEEGEFIAAGSPAFRLLARDERRAIFSVPAEDAQGLQEQGLVYIRHGGLDYAAQITRVTRSAQQPRLVELSAELYPAETAIPTGTVAQVRYTVPLASGVIVPSAALAAEAGRTYVFVVEDGVARRTEVRVNAESAAQAVVEGISEGARVISPRPLDVREGTPVEPVDE